MNHVTLKIWAQHFESLATSGVSEREELRNVLNAIVGVRGGSQHTEVGNYYSCVQRQWQRSS